MKMRCPSATSNRIRPTWPGTVVTTVAGVPSVVAVTTASGRRRSGRAGGAGGEDEGQREQRGEPGEKDILVLRSEWDRRSAQLYGSRRPQITAAAPFHEAPAAPGYSPVADGLASLSSSRWPSGSRKKQRTSQPWSTGGVRNSAPRPRSVS